MSEEIHGDVPIEKSTLVAATRITVGDILTFVAIFTLLLVEVFVGTPEGRIKYLYLITYLVIFIFIVIKSLLRGKVFALKERFVFLLVTAWAALVSVIELSINFWNGKLLFRPLVFSTSWLVIAAYQFFIFSSKDLQETQ